MGKPKKYDIRTVNFGEEGHPARMLVDQYTKRCGKQALSELIRRLVVIYLSENPTYQKWKVTALEYERKEIIKEVHAKVYRKKVIEEELEKLGMANIKEEI